MTLIMSITLLLIYLTFYVLLVFKVKNNLYRSLGIALPLIILPMTMITNANLLGEPRSLQEHDVTLQDRLKIVEVLGYHINPETDEIFALVINENAVKPIYIRLFDVSKEEQEKFDQKGKEAAKNEAKMFLKFEEDGAETLGEGEEKESLGISTDYPFDVIVEHDFQPPPNKQQPETLEVQ